MIFASLLLAPSALLSQAAQARTCNNSKKVVGDCFKVHGRLRTYNGIGAVIWWIGTDRKLAVGEAEIPAVPSEAVNYGIDYFADFEVCPLGQRREGEMQRVCVESAKNVVMVDHRPEDKGKKAVVRKIDGGTDNH
jgi:hypothetical protein